MLRPVPERPIPSRAVHPLLLLGSRVLHSSKRRGPPLSLSRRLRDFGRRLLPTVT